MLNLQSFYFFVTIVFAILLITISTYFLYYNNYTKTYAMIIKSDCKIENNFKYLCKIRFMYYANNQKFIGSTSLYNQFTPFRKFDQFPIYYDSNNPYVFKLNNRHIIWPLFPLFTGIALIIGAAFTNFT
jgi:hypothetical protein|tara:strand:- start:3081 stop:3467 length:387 start_codon:yes stop_codon:yes gene_type:complete